MSLENVWLGSQCGREVYETESADIWAACESKRARLNAGLITLAVGIILVLFLAYSTATANMRTGMCLAAFLLIGYINWEAFYLRPRSARVDYDRAQQTLKTYTDTGMSRADALRSLQQEALARAQIGALSMRQPQQLGVGSGIGLGAGIGLGESLMSFVVPHHK